MGSVTSQDVTELIRRLWDGKVCTLRLVFVAYANVEGFHFAIKKTEACSWAVVRCA